MVAQQAWLSASLTNIASLSGSRPRRSTAYVGQGPKERQQQLDNLALDGGVTEQDALYHV